MMRLGLGMRIFLVACFATVLVIASGLGWRWWQNDRAEQQHADRNETELHVGLAQHSCSLYQAGATLRAARLMSQVDAGSTWIGPGSYFIKVSEGGRDLHYPVPILGYRLGPDRDGAFVVTVRPPPASDPPRARPDSPPFAFIPSGEFLIGDRANPREIHYVWVPAFFTGVFEVTNAEFRDFQTDPSGFAADANWTQAGREWKSREQSAASAMLKPGDSDYQRFGQPDQPVTSVTWYEAAAYCRWLTAHSGGGRWTYWLPDDAEWEKAARGPDQFDYGLGNTISDAETPLYNWKKNPGVPVTVIGWGDTRRSFLPNRYGLYHASGNVAEWTRSAFVPYSRQQPYADDRRNNPETSERRTVRGGSWYSATTAPLSLPYRDGFQPWRRDRDVGFRVAAKIVP